MPDEINIDAEIGKRVARMMRTHNVTQAALAAEFGLTPGAISRKLHGDIPWSARELYLVTELFECTVSALFPPKRAAGSRCVPFSVRADTTRRRRLP